MDFENNGQNTTNFMSKVKKQAKRLFQLSKTNQSNLQIKSLSQAQEVLAQINGYPDWHALESHIVKSKTILVKNVDEARINLERYEYGNLHYYQTEETITTFLRVNSLPGKVEKLQKIIENFNDILSFQLNMGIHGMSIIFEQKNRKYDKESSYSLYEVSKSFNLSESEAKKLFYIDKSNSKPFDENSLTVYIIITTPIKHKKEHFNICLNMLDNYNDLAIESIPYLDKEQLENFQLKNGTINKELKNSLFQNPIAATNIKETNKIIINKWVYLLNYLHSEKIGFLLKYSLINEEIIYEFENYNSDKELIDSIILSAIKTHIFVEQELNYLTKPNFNYIMNEDKSGLSLKSQFSNKIFNYNDSSDIRTSHIDLIFANPGYGKSILNNMVALSSILGKDLNNLPKIGIIDVGPSYQGMISLIKNILPVEMKHMVQQYDISNSAEYAINLLDLPLGKRIYEYEDITRIVQVIISLFDKTESLSEYLHTCLSFLNELSPKHYTINENLQIDKTLEKLSFIAGSETTWWNIVDFLFVQGLPDLALKAQRYATPIISDIIFLLSKPTLIDIYGQVKSETGETLIKYVSRNLTDFTNNYPHLNQTTKFELGQTKIAYFNLNNICDLNPSQYYWFGLILNLTTHKLIEIKYTTKNYPQHWNEDWKNYLNKSTLKYVYEYYNNSNGRDNWKITRKIIIDEFHRFSNNYHSLEQVTILTRESRKNNISISIATQSLKNLTPIIDYVTAFFTTGIRNENSDILKNAGFENNEIELMKKTKFLSWAIKLKTNRGKIFDIVKLEIPVYLGFALSCTSEDILVKNELMKKNTYFGMLNKSVNYLNKNKLISFKIYFERELQNKVPFEKIIKQLINEIENN